MKKESTYRNAGRNPIPNPIRKNFLIPMSREKEVIDFIRNIQNEEIQKEKNKSVKV